MRDSKAIRENTLLYDIPYTTTLEGAKAIIMAIADAKKHPLRVFSLQEYYTAHNNPQ